MNRTGIVYDIQNNKAVVFTSESEFIIVRRRKDMNIGQQVSFENREIYNPKRTLLLNAVAVACSAAVFIMTFLYFRFFISGNSGNVYGYIGVDINPSVEFEIKGDYRVLKMRSLNREGEQLAQEMDVKDKKIEDAVSELVIKSIDMGFIGPNDNRAVLISGALKEVKGKSSSENGEEETQLYRLLSNIKNNLDNDRIDGHIILIDSEERKHALEKNISMGKYGLYLKAEKLRAGINFEDIYDMSVSEMIDKLNKDEPHRSADVSNPQTPALSTPKPEMPTPEMPQKTDVASELTLIETPTPEPTIKPTTTPVGISAKESLIIQYYNRDKNETETVQGIKYNFIMKNNTNSVIDLKNVKVRYYFTEDVSLSDLDAEAYFFSCGNPQDVHCMFYNLSGSKKANKYLEITFSTGSLFPEDKLYVEGMFHKKDWSYFDQRDDYSYNPSYYPVDKPVDWKNMTAYINDVLVWGQEP